MKSGLRVVERLTNCRLIFSCTENRIAPDISLSGFVHRSVPVLPINGNHIVPAAVSLQFLVLPHIPAFHNGREYSCILAVLFSQGYCCANDSILVSKVQHLPFLPTWEYLYCLCQTGKHWLHPATVSYSTQMSLTLTRSLRMVEGRRN